jgi:hypothetical protein
MRFAGTFFGLLVLMLAVGGCGDDDGTEAVRRGIGDECMLEMSDGASDRGNCDEAGQVCLTEFSGGYCGARGCTADADCPEGSACVTDDGTTNYCFLICLDKPECNTERSVANESNCNSSLTFVDPGGDMGRKVCRPPLGGT